MPYWLWSHLVLILCARSLCSLLHVWNTGFAIQLAEAKAKCEQEIKVEPDTPTELSTGQNGASDSSTGQNVTSGIKSCKVEEPCESGDNNREDGNHAGRTWVPSTSHGKSPSLPDRPTCTVGEPTPRLLTKGSSITTRRSRRMAGGVDPQITLAQLVR